MRRTLVSAAAAAVVVFGIAGCGDSDDAGAPPDQQQGQQGQQGQGDGGQGGQPEMPEPNLDGIPEVVAVVNGEEIARADFVETYTAQFQQAQMQAQMSGQPVDEEQLRQQTAESMVGTELLVQEADSRDYDVSQDEIDSTLDEIIASSSTGSRQEFLDRLQQEQDMSEDEVMSEVETQVEIERLVAEEGGDTEPTEQELRQLYDQMSAQQQQQGGQGGQGQGGQGQEPPSFEEARPQLEEQLRSQKEGQAAQQLVDQLRQDGEVEVNL